MFHIAAFMLVLVLSHCYWCVFALHFPEITCVQTCNDFSLDFLLDINFLKVSGLSFQFFKWKNCYSLLSKKCIYLSMSQINFLSCYSGMCSQLRAISGKQKRIKHVSAFQEKFPCPWLSSVLVFALTSLSPLSVISNTWNEAPTTIMTK